MASNTELEYKQNIDAMPSLDRQSEAPTSRMYNDAYDRDSLRSSSLRPDDRGMNLPGLERNFGLLEYNRPGGSDFDYRRQGGSSYDFRPYLSNVYGCGCNGGEGCSCWDRSKNYYNQDVDPNNMICGLDAEGKYHGPASWRNRLFNGRSDRFNQRSQDVDPNTMICGLDADGKYHGPSSWKNRLFNGQSRSVCGPDGCYPMDQSRNYYNGRQADQVCGMDQSGKFYGDNRGMSRGTRYSFNGEGESGAGAGDCSGGSCSGGPLRTLGRIATFPIRAIGRLLGRHR